MDAPIFTDINLQQKDIREDYVQYWKDDDFESAYNIIINEQLDGQAVQKILFNSILQSNVTFPWNLTDMQEQGLEEYEDFKADRIKVSETAPVGLTVGQVYFQIQ